MIVKLLGPWVIANNCVEQYYTIYRYISGTGWLLRESGWQRLFGPTEVTKYNYNPYTKGKYIEYTPKGMEFNFRNADEYLFYCTLQEETEDGWPAPSWAIACELLPDWLE
jgi:hypothetical protein